MIESRLISKRDSIIAEMKQCPNPQRKQRLLATLLGLERDIKRMGWTDEEVKQNSFEYSGSNRTIEGRQLYVPTAQMWDDQNKPNQKNDPPKSDVMQRHREKMLAELNDNDSRGDFWAAMHDKLKK
jgi:hypothetical protein